MNESLNDKVVRTVPSEQARDGALANLHSCMDCRFNADGVCSRYGDACSRSHHCVNWDMTYQAEADLRKAQKAQKEKYGK